MMDYNRVIEPMIKFLKGEIAFWICLDTSCLIYVGKWYKFVIPILSKGQEND